MVRGLVQTGNHVAIEVLVIQKRQEDADEHDEDGFNAADVRKDVQHSVAVSRQNALV